MCKNVLQLEPSLEFRALPAPQSRILEKERRGGEGKEKEGKRKRGEGKTRGWYNLGKVASWH